MRLLLSLLLVLSGSVLAAEDKPVALFDGKTKRCLARETLTEETQQYAQGFSASFSPDGKHALVSYSELGVYLVSL